MLLLVSVMLYVTKKNNLNLYVVNMKLQSAAS